MRQAGVDAGQALGVVSRTDSVTSPSRGRPHTAAGPMGGGGALRGALGGESGLLQAGQRQIQEAVGSVHGEVLALVAEYAVVEGGIVQLYGQGVCEVGAAADRPLGLMVRQAEQGLRYACGGPLGHWADGDRDGRRTVGAGTCLPKRGGTDNAYLTTGPTRATSRAPAHWSRCPATHPKITHGGKPP